MEEDKKIKVIIQRGTNQIGGVCTEIATEEARIFFDVGAPLEGEGNQKKLDIEGLTKGVCNTDAIFLTHYHGDHVGEIQFVSESIPIYMEKTAKRILEIQQEHMKYAEQPVWENKVTEIAVGKPVQIKDLTVTPIASDHSAANSVMYLIEGHNKRILITGDYRLHGNYRDKLIETFKNLGKIDLMITEGTTIARDSSINRDEKWVEEQFKQVFKKYKYVFLLTSSAALDRIAAFSRCVPDGKYMITDRYQQELIKVYDENREEKHKSRKVLYISDYVMERAEKTGFGMVVRANYMFPLIVKDYFERYPDQTIMLYSMWSGYCNLPAIKQMLDFCGGKERTIHVSGHITKEDLEYVLKIVKPGKLLIYHTNADEEEIDNLLISSDIELLHKTDGAIIDV